jgi:hypothetical protein
MPNGLVNPTSWFGLPTRAIAAGLTGSRDSEIALNPDDQVLHDAVVLSVAHDDAFKGKGCIPRIHRRGTYDKELYFECDDFVEALAKRLQPPGGDLEVQDAWDRIKPLVEPNGMAAGNVTDESTQGPKLLRCHTIAYDSCQWVNAERPDLVPRDGNKRYTQAMYDYVMENYPKYNDPENPITRAGFESWCRYIRLCEQRGYKGGTSGQQQPRSAVSRADAEDLGHLASKFGKPD